MTQFAFHTALTSFARLMQEAGVPLYAVGGLPRNALLGIPPSDTDVCSKLTPDEISTLCGAHGIHVVHKAPLFGTVELHLPGLIVEHTTFRGDRYGQGGAHRPEAVQFGATLEEDAFRRDFTCNALYVDICSHTLYDPTGGVIDIEKRLLRATSADPHDILKDDGLRVMRLARFACELGFDIEQQTWRAACACVHGLQDIAWERKRDELIKILLSDTKYPALTEAGEPPIYKGLSMLYKMGALTYLIPELLEGDGVLQRTAYHAYDVMNHNFHACAAAHAALILRLAGLLHDVGKPAALREKGLSMVAGGGDKPLALPKGVTPMLGHDRLGAGIAREILTRLRFEKRVVEEVVFLIEHHMYDLNGRAKQSTLRARFAAFGYARSLALCSIREADMLGSGLCAAFCMRPWRDTLARMQAEGAPFSIDELHCGGNDIMEWLDLPPGKEIGDIKERLLKHCACHPADNTKERLKKIVGGMRQSLSK